MVFERLPYTKGVNKLGRVQCRSAEVIRDWSKKKPGELGLCSLVRRRRRMGWG